MAEMSSQAFENTDREIWREREGDFYADSIHVTKDGGIGIDCGGHVIVLPIRKLHAAALRSLEAQPDAGEPVRWWNGMRHEGESSVSMREDTWHDIPLYAGVNPCNLPSPDQRPERRVAQLDVWNICDEKDRFVRYSAFDRRKPTERAAQQDAKPCPPVESVSALADRTEPAVAARPQDIHLGVFEYDGAYRCGHCKAEWGALPGNPTMPATCAAPQEAAPQGAMREQDVKALLSMLFSVKVINVETGNYWRCPQCREEEHVAGEGKHKADCPAQQLADLVLAASPAGQWVSVPMDVAKGLHKYGTLHPIEGVLYPEGGHQYLLNELERAMSASPEPRKP